MTDDKQPSNVIQVDFERTLARPKTTPPVMRGVVQPVGGRCLNCAHWAPGDRRDEGRCFGHHRLPSTAGTDHCSAWRRRRLACIAAS